jgi:hypothetical protein
MSVETITIGDWNRDSLTNHGLERYACEAIHRWEETLLQNLQIALFVSSPITAHEVAGSVFPGEPISSSMSQQQVSTAEFQGPITRRIVCSPGRIDFTWEPQATPPKLPEAEVSLVAVAEVRENIGAYAASLPVSRVATILTYRERADSAVEAVARLQDKLPGLEVPKGTNEISYRINVPSDIEGFTLNRNITWQTSKVLFVGMILPNTVPEQVTHYVWEWTIDVNSLQERPLGAGVAGTALVKVFDEAVRLGEVGLSGL